MEINITRLSSKGQVVIPREMRRGFEEGEKLIIIQEKDSIILRKANSLQENFKEDLEFARRTEEAWKEHDKGNFIEMEGEDFLKEIEKW